MHCRLCPEVMPVSQAMDHLRVMHPDAYGDGPMTWPDGEPVIVDMTLEPHEFWTPARPGDTPGALAPGEDDVTEEPT